MGSYVPFVNTRKDWEYLRDLYTEPALVRTTPVALMSKPDQFKIPGELWVDPAFDVFHFPEENHRDQQVQTFMSKFTELSGFEAALYDPEKLEERRRIALKRKKRKKPTGTRLPPLTPPYRTSFSKVKDALAAFVSSALDDASGHNPDWLSVPQVPMWGAAGQNTLNMTLAKLTAAWAQRSRFAGRLMLPVVIQKSAVHASKSSRQKVVKDAANRARQAGAGGIWVVDASMADQETPSPQTARLGRIVRLHEAFSVVAEREGATVVAGPYWGLNLILWSRGLADHPAVGLGNGYQYHLPAWKSGPSAARVAVPPLRRWVVQSGMSVWLNDAIRETDSSHPARAELVALRRQVQQIRTRGMARRQVADFYLRWLTELETTPREGRAMRLYQEFSAAFVLGKTLARDIGNLPDRRAPWKVAEQFMLNCL